MSPAHHSDWESDGPRRTESEWTPEPVLDAIPVGVVCVLPSGEVHALNDEFAELCDHSRAELVGKPLGALDAVEPFDSNALRELGDDTIDVEIGDTVVRFSAVTINDEAYRLGVRLEGALDRRVRRRLERFSSIVDAVGDGIYELDLSGYIVRVNDVVVEVTGYEREELEGAHVSKVLTDEDIERTTNAIESLYADDPTGVAVEELHISTSDGTVIPVEVRISLLEREGELQGTVGVVRDISSRKARQQAIRRQRNELAELNRINAVIRDVNQMLVGSESRSEIESEVCKRLAASDSYVLAWFAGQTATGSDASPTVSDTDLETIEQLAATPMSSEPIPNHVESTSVAIDESTARAVGDFESGQVIHTAAIPITYRDLTYGLLHLYAYRDHGFSDRELEVLNELGNTIGMAINAIDAKTLLHTDTIVRLTFDITDPDSLFLELSDALDCSFELADIVQLDGDKLLFLISVTEINPTDIVDRVRSASNYDEVEVLSEHDDGGLIQVTRSGPSAIQIVHDAGGEIHTVTIEDGHAKCVVNIAPNADVNALVDAITKVKPGATLEARTELDRPIETSREFTDTVRKTLTDKQRVAVQSAYRAGYFSRPRPVTGASLAASLGVTPSTFHHHLQAGLNKLVASVFDEY